MKRSLRDRPSPDASRHPPRPPRGRRGGRAHLGPRDWLAGIGAAACLSCAPPSPVAGPAEGRALARLDLGAVQLLPAASLSAPPPPAPSHQASIPAFDRAHLVGLSAQRSYSIGTASRGYLVGARRLTDTGPLRARPISVRRGAVWGTDELVGALERAARRVADQWPGSVLWAGDLSARDGGDLHGHASHNSGRDVDLAFYVRDGAWRIADQPELVPFGADGRARWGGDLWFDDARNWALVEGLLRDPRVQIQWIFVSNPLKARLIAWARSAGADPLLVERAEAVLREPRDSSRHEEHFHVRLYCALEERVEGCVDQGPTRPWVDTWEAALAERVAEVVPLLRAGGPDELRYAITRLVRLKASQATPHLEPLTAHADPEIRALAADAVAFLRGERTPPAWAHLTGEDVGD